MPKVSKLAAKPSASKPTVRSVRSAGARVSPRPQPEALPREAGIRQARQAQGIFAALEIAGEGEGSIITMIANPRCGKTYVAKQIVRLAENRGEFVLIHDPKFPGQYDGWLMYTHNDIDPERIGTYRCSTGVQAEDLAETALRLVKDAGEKVTLVIDELTYASSNQRWKGENLERCYTEGGSQGLTTLALTQSPQALPRQALDYPHAILIFRCAGRGLDYLSEIYRRHPDLVETIAKLQRGQFVVVSPFDDWDRTVYGPQ